MLCVCFLVQICSYFLQFIEIIVFALFSVSLRSLYSLSRSFSLVQVIIQKRSLHSSGRLFYARILLKPNYLHVFFFAAIGILLPCLYIKSSSLSQWSFFSAPGLSRLSCFLSFLYFMVLLSILCSRSRFFLVFR